MSKKGFTLVELMVVILIVAILAAVAIPIMRGRVDAAKWSEGKAMMGTIATAIRAYVAEVDKDIPDLSTLVPTELLFQRSFSLIENTCSVSRHPPPGEGYSVIPRLPASSI